jgi:hypothetical protein
VGGDGFRVAKLMREPRAVVAHERRGAVGRRGVGIGDDAERLGEEVGAGVVEREVEAELVVGRQRLAGEVASPDVERVEAERVLQ